MSPSRPRLLVAGLINLETTVAVEGFPVTYEEVRYPFFGINTTVSGVGYNLAKALSTLGDHVHLLSLVADDAAGGMSLEQLRRDGFTHTVPAKLTATPQSVIAYDPAGRRMVNTDLKDTQDVKFPTGVFDAAVAGSEAALLCNVNWVRPLLARAKAAAVPIATDVHAVDALEDPYDGDFMGAADILFMSHERLPVSPSDWLDQVMGRYKPEVAVVGLAKDGALLAEKGSSEHRLFPARPVGKVVSTVGAGDALFSAFVHYFIRGGNAPLSLEKALLFAQIKIGTAGGAEGFVDEETLEDRFAALTR